jgi:hypothetical protein
MGQIKALKFLGSDEELKIIEEIRNLLGIDWKNEKAPRIFSLTEDILRYNQTSETPVKELIKKWLDFLQEDEVNKLYQFLEENFLPKVRALWQEEDITEEESEENEKAQEAKETFEEKERRYVELMKVVLPQKVEKEAKEEKTKEEPQKTEEVKYKTISFEPEEELPAIPPKKEVTEEETLEDNIIIISKKKEEPEEKGGEEVLDLSKL